MHRSLRARRLKCGRVPGMFRLNYSCLALLPLAFACGTDVGGSPSLPEGGAGGSAAGAGGSDAGTAGETGGQPEGGTSGASGSAGEGGTAGVAGDGGSGGDTGGFAGAGGTAGTTGGNAGTGGAAGAPTELVVEQWGTSEVDVVNALVAGGAGSVIAVGKTRGAMVGPGSDTADIFVARRNPDGVNNWTRQIDGGYDDAATAAVLGADGKIYVTGHASALNAGDPIVKNPFLSRWNWNGDLEQTWRWGSDAADEAWGLAQGDGFFYVAGSTIGDIGPSGRHGGRDGFVTKLNASGSPIWSRQWGEGSGKTDDPWTMAWDVAVDADGSVYVTGETHAELEPDRHAGDRDAFLVKYDADGTLEWIRQWGSPRPDGGTSVAVDSAGDIWVAGYAFGPLGRDGAGSAMLGKFSPDGGELWIEQWGATWADDIFFMPDGRTLVSGQAGDVDDATEKGNGDAFLSYWTEEDTTERSRTTHLFGTAGTEIPNALDVDDAGTIYVAGQTTGSFPGFTMQGQSDAFLLRIPPE